MSKADRLRFQTVADLFGAFPTAEIDVGREPSTQGSLEFVRALAAERDFRSALSYLSYLLGRREAVWWACGCIRQLGEPGPDEQSPSRPRRPGCDHPTTRRVRALEEGTRCRSRFPATWLALAAGWSGGNLPSGGVARIPPPPQMTAQAVRTALLIGTSRVPATKPDKSCQNGLQRGCVTRPLRARAEPASESLHAMRLTLTIENHTNLPDGGPLSFTVTEREASTSGATSTSTGPCPTRASSSPASTARSAPRAESTCSTTCRRTGPS